MYKICVFFVFLNFTFFYEYYLGVSLVLYMCDMKGSRQWKVKGNDVS